MEYLIRAIRADEWAAVKELRLAALRDPVAHLAFLETYEEASAKPEAFWRDRAAGAAEGASERQQFIAEDTTASRAGADGGSAGRVWGGSVTVLVEEADAQDPFGSIVGQDQGHLVGVFVRPEYRGSGMTGVLFDAALAWSWARGLERVRLFVHERNARAEAFYRKAGFVPTGLTTPVPGDPDSRELEYVIKRP
ncbi:GNAT family N-acetyltransferase [Streptomyces sp. NPDC008313]|uniref:GNAT family N-acetyltransferase n=1 Tax=Streptomyces sp. NPDC008313 TaxID=3364826 RepID=UPI0036E0954E